jgi:hypothetical protein
MVSIPADGGKGLLGGEAEVVVGVGSGTSAGSTFIGEPWHVDGGSGTRCGATGGVGIGMWKTAVGISDAEGLDEKEKVGGL